MRYVICFFFSELPAEVLQAKGFQLANLPSYP